MNANVVMCEKSRHRETEIRKPCLTRNDTVNQRIQNAIAKEVTEDLLGHHTMHAHCASRSGASLSVVAPSRVPVRLDVQREVYPPPTFTGVK